LEKGTRNWEKAILNPGALIGDAIRILNSTSLRIVLIVDTSGLLKGTISDGDIRRAILRGLDLTSPIDEIVNYEPVTVSAQTSYESVKRLMQQNKIYQIPILDEHSRLKGLHLWDEILDVSTKENKFVIMAGGKGTRLLPITENTPKPMLQIGGKPILEHIILQAKAEGFFSFYLAIHHLGNMIQDYFGDGSKLGVKIEYLVEKDPLGTAGALSLIDPIPNRSVVVTNGDVLSRIRYSDILEHHLQNDADASVAVQTYEWQNPFGVVRTKGLEIISYDEKPISRSLINAGVYVFNAQTLLLLEKSRPCDIPDFLALISRKNLKSIVFPIHEPWIDIGRPDDFRRAVDQLTSSEIDGNTI
jgi:dTDP-glucose pyrophosphorylase